MSRLSNQFSFVPVFRNTGKRNKSGPGMSFPRKKAGPCFLWLKKSFLRGSRILFLLLVIVSLSLPECAKVGTVTGGPKDTIPPVVLHSEPPFKATGIQPKKIVIAFNEFLDLKNIQQELLVSPPMHKQPEVKLKGKKIEVIISDTLLENTTYTLNFGNAITDFTENNPVPGFIYVFSTGNYVDSFAVKGSVINSYDLKVPKEPVMVMLYDQLSDSAPYRMKPLYIGRTDKNGSFRIPFLKEGTYNIIALDDANNNLRYDPPDEMIGFDDSLLVLHPDSFRIDVAAKDTGHTIGFGVPSDSLKILPDSSPNGPVDKEYAAVVHFRLFKELPSIQYLKDYKRPEACLLSIYLNMPSHDTVTLEPVDTIITQPWYLPEMTSILDTFLFWITDSALIKQPNLRLLARFPETDSSGITSMRSDTLRFSFVPKAQTKPRRGEKQEISSGFKLTGNVSPGKIIELNESLILETPHPIHGIDTSLIDLQILKDSIFVPCHYQLNRLSGNLRKLRLDVPWVENSSYQLTFLPGAVQTIYHQINDTLKVRFKTREAEYYGKLIVTAQNVTTPVVYELLENDKVVLRKSASSNGSTVFELLLPKKYKLRAIADANANGQWDTGNYLKKIQPEKVVIYPADVEIRSNWDLELSVDMSKAL
ncbi:MAG: Ig-like domain-containing protein [Bacteroidales bacterium]|nr:Ig-like domain-containing protein [Bacteroidales bacterium]